MYCRKHSLDLYSSPTAGRVGPPELHISISFPTIHNCNQQSKEVNQSLCNQLSISISVESNCWFPELFFGKVTTTTYDATPACTEQLYCTT